MSGRDAPAALRVDDAGRKRQTAFLEKPRLPGGIERLVESYIEKKTGKPWNDPVVLDRIANAILAQKSRYWKERQVSYRKAYHVLGYLVYHAPVYVVQFEHILWQIIDQGLAKQHMRILDLGTGPGVVPLAVIDLMGRIGIGTAEVYAVERSEESLEAYNAIVPAAALAAAGERVRVHGPLLADIEALEPAEIPGGIDLMVFSNVLNELRHLEVEQRAGAYRIQPLLVHPRNGLQPGAVLDVRAEGRDPADPVDGVPRGARRGLQVRQYRYQVLVCAPSKGWKDAAHIPRSAGGEVCPSISSPAAPRQEDKRRRFAYIREPGRCQDEGLQGL